MGLLLGNIDSVVMVQLIQEEWIFIDISRPI